VCTTTTARCAIEQIIRTIIYSYWIFFGNELGLRVKLEAGRKLQCVNDLMISICELKKYEDAVIVLCVLYISFDWLPESQSLMTAIKHKQPGILWKNM
jgi:hypothetical protein